MTLNITVISKNRIYQSSDYQLFDEINKRPLQYGAKKIFSVSTYEWSATISFTGIATGYKLSVSLWLSKIVNSIDMVDPFQKLVDLLLKADQWLASVGPAERYLSISIGAFLKNKPHFVFLSNFESISGSFYRNPSKTLKVERLEPDIPMAFVTGQKHSISSADKSRLCSIAILSPNEEHVFERIYEQNRKVAKENNKVSDECEIVCLDSLGRSRFWYKPYSRSMLHFEQHPIVTTLTKLIPDLQKNNDKEIKLIASTRFPRGEIEHLHFIKVEPDKPYHYTNYANFLIRSDRSVEKAEEMCQIALGLNPECCPAINILGYIETVKGNDKKAESLYLQGLENTPSDTSLGTNYAAFLRERDRLEESLTIIDTCIHHNPDYKKARLIKGEILFSMRNCKALDEFDAARGHGCDQKRVEFCYAMATSLANLPLANKISSYRTALSLQPDDPNLLLNLSQLLFLSGYSVEAEGKLMKAVNSNKLSGSALLEAYFYQVAHTKINFSSVTEKIKDLLDKGCRLDWSVDPDIEMIGEINYTKSSALKRLKALMVSASSIDCLDSIFRDINKNSNKHDIYGRSLNFKQTNSFFRIYTKIFSKHLYLTPINRS